MIAAALKKDLLLLKRNPFLVLIQYYGVLAVGMFLVLPGDNKILPGFPESYPFFLSHYFFLWAVFQNINQEDQKYQAFTLLLSTPYTVRELVWGRYLFGILTSCMAFLFYLPFAAVIPGINWFPYSYAAMCFLALFMACLLVSVLLPILYLSKPLTSSIAAIFVMAGGLSILFLSNLVFGLLVSRIPVVLLYLIGLPFMALLLFLSASFTVRRLEKKEF